MKKKNLDTKRFNKLYESFIEKLSLLNEMFLTLKKNHFEILFKLISEHILDESLLNLVNSGNS
jgi:hypothetical protein